MPGVLVVRTMRTVAASLIALALSTPFVWGETAQAPAEQPLQPTSNATAAPALPETPPPGGHELTAEDLETFFDGLVPYQIEVNDVAGATISVVKDGKLLFAKGYGYADVAKKTPVSAETTLFRIGSISKLFTWTAVMQLVEQGKLDLDADVNTYLDFKVPASGKTITLRNLMTHRPGFEEVVKELGAQKSGKPDLTSYVKDHIPAQIFQPGTTPAYSNYGTALAGYIVQRVSGVAFENYIEEHVTGPLGMKSTFRQPLPEALAPTMSQGYMLGSGEPMAFEVVNAYPAGSVSASATDMTHFMIAHLQDGQLDGAQILRPETAQAMHNTRLETAPGLNAMALGFYEETRNGHRIIGHGGDTTAFHSDLHLIPDANVGFFVSYNSQGRGDTSPRAALWRKFMDRYFPLAPMDAKTLETAVADAQLVAGTYITSRRQESSIFKITGQLDQTVVTPREDGTLEIAGFIGINGQPRHWREVGPLVYQDIVGQDKIAFVKGEGEAMRLWLYAPIIAYDRIGFFQSSTFIFGVFGASLAVILLTLVLWPVAAVTRWHYGTPLPWSTGEKLLGLGVKAVLALDVVFLGWLALVFAPMASMVWALDRSLDPTLNQIQYVGIAGAAGSLLVVFNALRAWSSETRGFFGKLKETVVALAAIGFAWFAWTMQLFDLSLRY